MAKLNKKNNINVPVSKGIRDIIKVNEPKILIESIPYKKNSDKFLSIINSIHNINKDECLTIDNNGTGIDFYELRKKVTNVVFSHKLKFVDKEFHIKKIGLNKLRVFRVK